jgi:hypothetical protein
MSSTTSTQSRNAISPRKLAANRQNAQKSTGPRTPQGKEISSKNATTHALFCSRLLLPSESKRAFHNLRHAYLHRLNPQDLPELHLADRIVSIAWRLKRIQQADHDLHLGQSHHFEDKPGDHENDPDLTEEDLDHSFPPLSPGLVIAATLNESAHSPQHNGRTTAYERLLAIENRLHGMMSRAQKELRQFQKERKAQEEGDGIPENDHCPFLPPPKTGKELLEDLIQSGEFTDPKVIEELRAGNDAQPDDEDDQTEDDADREGEARLERARRGPPEPRSAAPVPHHCIVNPLNPTTHPELQIKPTRQNGSQLQTPLPGPQPPPNLPPAHGSASAGA